LSYTPNGAIMAFFAKKVKENQFVIAFLLIFGYNESIQRN